MRRTILAALATVPLLVPTPAHAAGAGVFVLQGSGVVSPGLGLVPEEQTLGISATMTVVGTDPVLATRYCAFGGREFGSVAAGQGYVGGDCGGDVHCDPGPWERAFGTVTWTCLWGTTTISMECAFRPHQVLPVTSFDITCEGRYAYA